MANPFNPQKPQDSALNAVMLGAMGTGKKANKIITFDAANQNLSNGALVPPENLIKAYNDNSIRTQIKTNKGFIETTVTSQFGFFMSEDDLLVVGNGSTWKMTWLMDFITGDSGTSWQVPYILDAELTTAAPAGFRTEAILFINMEANGETVKFYRQKPAGEGGGFAVFHTGAGVYTPEGTIVKCSIERRATDFNVIFDVDNVIAKQEAAINIASVVAHTKNLFAFGDLTNNNYTGLCNLNDITYPNAS